MTAVTRMRLEPPPPSDQPDVLDLTARQVRIDSDAGHATHALLGQPHSTELGRQYRTVCNATLARIAGAILTTRAVTCSGCGKTSLRGRAGGSRG